MDNPSPIENPWSSACFATAGEALIDLIAQPDGRYEPCPGGAVFNLTRALARQQLDVLYLNPMSSDRFGRLLASALVADGAKLSRPDPVAAGTSLAVVGLTDNGQPDYAFYRQGVADRAVTAEGLNASCAAAPALRVVCTGALALAPEDAIHYLPWLQAQRDAGKVIVVDANLRPSVFPDREAYRRNVRAALAIAHVIKVSDEDLVHLGGQGDDPLAMAERLLRESIGACWMLVTLGEQGGCLMTRDGQRWQARESGTLQVVDTVGAGDCFLAGFLAAAMTRALAAAPPPTADTPSDPAATFLAPLDRRSAHHLLSHAVASASLCVIRRGCQPPTAEEVRTRVGQNPCTLS